MLIFSISFPDLIKFPYFMDTPVSRVWGERRRKDRMTLQIILAFTLTCPKTFTQDRVSVFDKYLHWPCVSVKVIYLPYIYSYPTQPQNKRRVFDKNLGTF
jgi:hypothetical protein